MVKKVKVRKNKKGNYEARAAELRIADALERIADSLEAFEDAAIYQHRGEEAFVGVSVNHSPDVIGDDVFAPEPGDDQDEDG